MKSIGSIIVGQAAQDGTRGVSVTNVVRYYLATSAGSGVTIATSGWSTTVQTITTTNKYLWIYDKTFFSDGTTSVTTPSIAGVYGNSGYTYRLRGIYTSGDTYIYNTEYRDVILYKINDVSHAFRVRTQGLSVTAAPSSSSGDSNWDPANELKFVATELLLSRKIMAEEIDVNSLVVQNVLAKDENGNVTCSIDGNTGDVNIKGHLTLRSLSLSLIPEGGSLKDGYLILSSWGDYVAPELAYNEVMEVRFITPAATRVPVSITLKPKSSNVRIGTTIWLLNAVNSNVSVAGVGTILGFNINGITYWIISYNEKD